MILRKIEPNFEFMASYLLDDAWKTTEYLLIDKRCGVGSDF